MPLRFANPFIRTHVWIIAVLLTTFLSFLPSLDNDFVNWDDDVHLLENQAIRSLAPYDIGQHFKQAVNLLYIPLTSLSFAFEYHFYGYDPFIYHLDNVLLHLGNTLLIFLIVQSLGLSRLTAVLTSFIFGVHPMHVESVAWVTERKDVLYAFFYLLAVFFYLRYIKENDHKFFWFSWLCGLLSMLSKPMALSLPLILVLCDRYFDRKPMSTWLREKWMFVVYIIPLTWLSYMGNARVPSFDLEKSALTWLWCSTFYLKKFFFPETLLPVYQLPMPLSVTNPAHFFSVIIFLLAVGSVIALRRHRIILFAAGYYALSMFFLWRFDAFDVNVVGDRFMYLPMFGFCFLTAMIFEKILLRGQKSRYYLVVAAAGLTFIFGWLIVKTQAQCDVWQNGVALWEYQLKMSPVKPPALVYHKLGHARMKQREFPKAAARLKAFYQGQTDRVDPQDIGRVEQVIRWQQKALEVKSDLAPAHFVIGQVYQESGKPREAEAAYQTALAYDPDFFLAYVQLGRLYHEYGRFDAAIYSYHRAAKINSYNPYFVDELKKACEKIMSEQQR